MKTICHNFYRKIIFNASALGEWVIEAELNSKQNAGLYIHNTANQATFSYGKKKVDMNGKTYQCKKDDASVLFDQINGKWATQEMSDLRIQTMGKW